MLFVCVAHNCVCVCDLNNMFDLFHLIPISFTPLSFLFFSSIFFFMLPSLYISGPIQLYLFLNYMIANQFMLGLCATRQTRCKRFVERTRKPIPIVLDCLFVRSLSSHVVMVALCLSWISRCIAPMMATVAIAIY